MDLRDLNDDQRTFSEDLTNYDKKSKETVNEQIDALTNTFNSFKDDVSKKVQDQICYTRRRGPIQKRMLEFIEKFETNFKERLFLDLILNSSAFFIIKFGLKKNGNI